MGLNNIKINNTTNVKTGVVYDISKATGRSYETLSDALGTDGNNVPSEVREGGMSVRYVLTSEHKYVQYRLTATSFSADEVDWVEMDVEELIRELLNSYENSIAMSNGFIRCGGNIGDTVDLTINAHDNYRCAIIDCIQGDVFYVSGTGGYSNRLYAFVDSENKLASTPAAASYSTDTLIKIVAPENAVKLILNDYSLDNNFKNSYAYNFSTDPALNLYSKGLLSNKIITASIYDIIGFDYSLYIDTSFTYYTLPFTIKNGTKVKNTGTGLFYLLNSGGTEVYVNIDQEVTLSFDATILRSSSHIDRNYSLHIYGSLENKQDKLTFDDVPVENSNNPVKSKGIYDSIQDLSDNIGLVKIDAPLESNYTGYYISSGGGKYEGSLYTISKPFPVKVGDIISITAKASESVSVLSYYKTSDDSYEVIKLGEDASIAKEYKQRIPKDGLVVVCMMTAYFEQGICSIYRMSDKVLKDSEIINLYNPDTAIDNYRPSFYDGGDIEDAHFLCSDYIYIKGVSKVTIPYEAHMSAEPYMPYYDSKRTYINKITGTQHGELAEFTIPSEAFYIRVPNRKYKNLEETIINNPCTFMCINGTYSDYPSSYIAYGEIYDLQKGVLQSNIAENPLYGKKVVFTGDSICNGDSDEAHMDAPIFSTIGHGWAVRIGTKNHMLWTNKGVSGGTITDGETVGSAFTISDTDFGDNPDYIIMEGGTNDADRVGSILNGNIPENFGSYTLASNYNDTFDNTTFCGAVEYMFQRVMKNYPHAKKGFIIAHKMGLSSNGYHAEVNNRRAYFEVIIALCKKWGIPYIDLWETAPMCPKLPEHYTWQQAKLYSGGTPEKQDAQHPTADGFDILSPMIEAWMKTL